LTLHGVAAGRAVPRHGARAGDLIYVTGRLGGSLLGHHLRFTPRLAEGAWLARRSEVRAMMDLSDGLAKDLGSLTARGLAGALQPAAVPVSAAARRLARTTGRTALAHAVADGEDYELLLVLRRGSATARFERDWRRRFPRLALTLIGRFVPAGRLPTGALRLELYPGYEHLR